MKFILAFILLMLSYSMSSAATNFMTCVSKSQCCFSQLINSSSELRATSYFANCESSFDKSQGLSISDVESVIKPVSEINSNHYRLRRIIEGNELLNGIMHKFFLLREKTLVLDQSKSYYSDKDPHYSTICSDYYVFALRRILI